MFGAGEIDGLGGKGTGCSSGEPRFGSQHPHDGSSSSIALASGDLVPSSDLCRYQAHVCYTYTHAGCLSHCFISVKRHHDQATLSQESI